MEKSEVKKILIENITYIKETFYVKENCILDKQNREVLERRLK